MVMPRTTAEEPFAAGGAEKEEGRRPTRLSAPPAASPELEDRPRRRTFTAADKLRILREIDRAGPGGSGAILRHEAACGDRNCCALSWLRKGAAVHFLVASDPVKKHGPWIVANLRVVTSSGDPV